MPRGGLGDALAGMFGQPPARSTRRSKLAWGAGALVAAGLLAFSTQKGHEMVQKIQDILVKRKRGALTTDLLRKITFYAAQNGVPMALALASIDIESGFEVNAYNPECTGGTREFGKRGDQSPYVTCSNKSYRRYAIVKKNSRWSRAVDKDRPELWGSFGLCQLLPDVAWGWGYSPEQPNVGLFDLDTNLAVGMKKLGAEWAKRGNAADVRSVYVYGKDYATVLKTKPDDIKRVVGKFSERLALYEKMFKLPKVRRA
jgi:soluble lytic murein transglycosylase-like protein